MCGKSFKKSFDGKLKFHKNQIETISHEIKPLTTETLRLFLSCIQHLRNDVNEKKIGHNANIFYPNNESIFEIFRAKFSFFFLKTHLHFFILCRHVSISISECEFFKSDFHQHFIIKRYHSPFSRVYVTITLHFL